MSSTPDANEVTKADAWVSLMLQKGHSVSAVDLIQKYGVDPTTAQSILARFESRRRSSGGVGVGVGVGVGDGNLEPIINEINTINSHKDNRTLNSNQNQNQNQNQIQNQNKGPERTKQGKIQEMNNRDERTKSIGSVTENVNRTNKEDNFELPLGWAKLKDSEGYFYFNVLTQQRTRQKPEKPKDEEQEEIITISNEDLFNNVQGLTINPPPLPNNWDLLVDNVARRCKKSELLSVLKAMRAVAANLSLEDLKFRTLYVDNRKVQNKLLRHDGAYEFLLALGFTETEPRKLICQNPKRSDVNAAIQVLDQRIEQMKQNPNLNGTGARISSISTTSNLSSSLPLDGAGGSKWTQDYRQPLTSFSGSFNTFTHNNVTNKDNQVPLYDQYRPQYSFMQERNSPHRSQTNMNPGVTESRDFPWSNNNRSQENWNNSPFVSSSQFRGNTQVYATNNINPNQHAPTSNQKQRPAHGIVHRPYSESSPQPYVPQSLYSNNINIMENQSSNNTSSAQRIESLFTRPPLFSQMTSLQNVEEDVKQHENHSKRRQKSANEVESDEEKADALVVQKDAVTDAGPQETFSYLKNLERFNNHVNEREQELFGMEKQKIHARAASDESYEKRSSYTARSRGTSQDNNNNNNNLILDANKNKDYKNDEPQHNSRYFPQGGDLSPISDSENQNNDEQQNEQKKELEVVQSQKPQDQRKKIHQQEEVVGSRKVSDMDLELSPPPDRHMKSISRSKEMDVESLFEGENSIQQSDRGLSKGSVDLVNDMQNKDIIRGSLSQQFGLAVGKPIIHSTENSHKLSLDEPSQSGRISQIENEDQNYQPNINENEPVHANEHVNTDEHINEKKHINANSNPNTNINTNKNVNINENKNKNTNEIQHPNIVPTKVYFEDSVSVTIAIEPNTKAHIMVAMALVERGWSESMIDLYRVCVEDTKQADEILIPLENEGEPLKDIKEIIKDLNLIEPRFIVIHKDNLQEE